MTMLDNPTAEQVTSFCDRLKETLLKAVANGSPVCITSKILTDDIYIGSPAFNIPYDAVYTGQVWKIGYAAGAEKVRK